jgi:hypothetical protein
MSLAKTRLVCLSLFSIQSLGGASVASPASETLVRPRPKPAVDHGICSKDHWCFENPLPVGLALNAVGGSSSSDVWAAGDRGLLLHWDGSRWALSKSPTREDLHSVWSRGPNDVWAVGASAAVHFDGAKWEEVPTTEGSTLAQVWGCGDDEVWMAGTKLQHRVNGLWTVIDLPERVRLFSVHGSGPRDVWAMGERWVGDTAPPQVVMFHWDGASLKTMPLPYASSGGRLWVASPVDALAAGERGLLLRWNGKAWKKLPGVGSVDAPALSGVRGQAPFAATRGQGLFRAGGSARALATPARGDLRGVYAAAEKDVWVVGDGNLARFDGKTLTNAFYGTMTDLWAVHGLSSDEVWAAGDHGTLLRLKDGIWGEVPGVSNASLRGILVVAPGEVWAVGGRRLVHVDGSGVKEIDAPGGRALASLWGTGPKDVWAGGAQGTLLHFDGASWTTIPARTTVTLTSLSGSTPDDVWAAGDGSEALHWDGKAWTTHRVPGRITAVLSSAPGLAFAAGEDRVWQWKGSAFQEVISEAKMAFLGVWGPVGGEVWAFGRADHLYRYNGVGWRREEIDASELRAAWGTASGSDVWVVGARGAILRRRY